MKYRAIILLIVLNTTTTNSANIETRAINREDLAIILDKLFEFKQCLDVVKAEEYKIGIQAELVLSIIQQNNIVVTFEKENKYAPHGYILLLDSLFKLEETLNAFYYLPGRTLLIVLESRITNFDKLKMLEQFGKTLGLQICLISPLPQKTEGHLLPQKDSTGITLLNKQLLWNSGVEISRNWSDFSLNKWSPPKDYNFTVGIFHCPPYVYSNSTHPCYDGIDCYLINFVAQANNWTINYLVREFNGYLTVAEDVQDFRAKAGICSMFVSFLDLYDVDISYPYHASCVTFLVPKPKVIHSPFFAFLPFTTTTWIFILVTLTVISFLYCKVSGNSFGYTLLEIYRFFIGSGLPIFPKRDILRFLSVLTAMNCIVITNHYLAFYAKSFKNPVTDNPITTLEEMIKSDVAWGAVNEADHILCNSSTTPRLRVIVDRFKLMDDEETLNNYIKRGNFGILVERVGNKFLAYTEVLDCFGRTHLMVLNECYAQLYMSVVLNKNSPLKAKIDKIVMKVYEQGLIKHWLAKTQSNHHGSFKSMMDYFTIYDEEYEVYKPISMAILQGLFYFLMLGHSAAGVAFIYEIVKNK